MCGTINRNVMNSFNLTGSFKPCFIVCCGLCLKAAMIGYYQIVIKKKINDKEEEQEKLTEVLMGIVAANSSSVKIGNYRPLGNSDEEGTYYFVE